MRLKVAFAVATAVALQAIMPAHHSFAEEKRGRYTEVRDTCHERNFYQIGGRVVLWSMKLCTSYQEVRDYSDDYPYGNVVEVKLIKDASTINWSPHGLANPFWSAKDCKAFQFTDDNGKLNVKGSCQVGFKFLLTAWSEKFNITERNIWAAFIIDGGNTDYLYPTTVDYYNETHSDPLPMTSPQNEDCIYYVGDKDYRCEHEAYDWYGEG